MNLGQKSNSSNGIKASDSESDSNTWPWKFSEVIHRSRSARHLGLQAPANVGDQPQQCPKIVNIMLNHDIHHPRVMVPKNVPRGTLLFPSKSARYRLGTVYL